MERKTLFIITSVINCTTNPLSYASKRSIFSIDDRAKQTLKTIESIRTNVPDSKILLIELGFKKDLPYNIESLVDHYLYLGHKKIIRRAADGPFKGLGEALGLYLGDRAIQSFQADYYYKISGRYYLDENFNETDWNSETYTARRQLGGICTVLYGFPKHLYQNWRSSLKESIPSLLKAQSLEAVQARYLEQPINYLTHVGVSGQLSVTGKFMSL